MSGTSFPKISIVTPNYNGGEFLEETILSVITQKYPNLEYIIIDGGSTDNSVEIIRKYQDYITSWISEPDQGMYHAIQKGFDCSTGEIMAWLNSDDMYHRNALFTVAEIFTSFQMVSWFSGASTFFDELGRTVSCYPSRMFSRYDFFNNDFKYVQQESVFWRRSLWEKSGSFLNSKLKYAGDFDLWLRFFQHDKLFITNALIGGFRYRSSNQLSIDHIDDYLFEVKMLVKQISLRDDEKWEMKKYQLLQKLEFVFNRLKMNRISKQVSRFRSKIFSKSKYVVFDRYLMKFVLSDP